MSPVTLSTATGSILPSNQFTRKGYRFRWWNTKSDGTGIGYADNATIGYNGSNVTLYAFWEPQVYKIRFDGNGATSGYMNDQLIQYDSSTALKTNSYQKAGYTFAGWKDSSGNIYSNAQAVTNLRACTMKSTKIKTLSAGKPLNTNLKFKSVQGSVVYSKNGHQYVVFAASVNDTNYYAGDLSHYETVLVKYDLTAGAQVAVVHNLQFDHGNGICYNPSNDHIYIAEGGSLQGYNSAVMELDSNLNYVATKTIAGVSNIYSIANYNGTFYALGKASAGGAYIYVLNQNFQIAGQTNVTQYYQYGYCSQGMAADGNFIYAITACFEAYQWKDNQKINVFTLSGQYVGTWSMDVGSEVEDISIDNGSVILRPMAEARPHFISHSSRMLL